MGKDEEALKLAIEEVPDLEGEEKRAFFLETWTKARGMDKRGETKPLEMLAVFRKYGPEMADMMLADATAKKVDAAIEDLAKLSPETRLDLALQMLACERGIERGAYTGHVAPVKDTLRNLWAEYPGLMETIKGLDEENESEGKYVY